MRWSDYYEKINDWAVSTAVNKISSLEDTSLWKYSTLSEADVDIQQAQNAYAELATQEDFDRF